MKLDKLAFPNHVLAKHGLHPFFLDGLKEVVVLVGRNGSGKTRFLSALKSHFESTLSGHDILGGVFSRMPPEVIEPLYSLPTGLELTRLVSEYLSVANEVGRYGTSQEDKAKFLRLERDISKAITLETDRPIILRETAEALSAALSIIDTKYFRVIKSEDIAALNQTLNETERNGVTLEKLISTGSKHEPIDEVFSVHLSGLDYIRRLPQRMSADALSSGNRSSTYKNKPSFKEFQKLKNLVGALLGKDLGWQNQKPKVSPSPESVSAIFQGKFVLNGHDFDYVSLSDGEKTLLAYALLFFLVEVNEELSIRDSILVIDEPELHLHASAEITLFSRLRELVKGRGQLIVATHSLSIISQARFGEIIIVRDSCVQGSTKNSSADGLRELVELQDRLDQISDFFASIQHWSFSGYLAECFQTPEVIQTSGKSDPQVNAFKKFLVSKKKKKKKLRILDVGAGKGRMFSALSLESGLLEQIDYSCVEPDPDNRSALRSLGISNVFEAIQVADKSSYDVVLLCNVLHEVEIEHWERFLGDLVGSVANRGYLIIVEAKSIAKGEKIGETGFNLLRSNELKLLFDLHKVPGEFETNDVNDRITFAVIPRAAIRFPPHHDDILSAIEALEERTFNEIVTLSKVDCSPESEYSIGRRYGFLARQNLNARVSIRKLNQKQKALEESYEKELKFI